MTLRKSVSTKAMKLIQAAGEGNVAEVKKLLDSGVPVDACAGPRDSRTALVVAAGCGHKDMVQLLLSRGANASDAMVEAALVTHASGPNKEILELLLSHGADPNVHDTKSTRPSLYGTTALFWAVRQGHVDIIKLLLEHGADPNVAERHGRGDTPLFWAVYWEQLDAARILLDNGSDANAKNKDGETPMVAAYYKGLTDMIALLHSRGADLRILLELRA